MARLLRTTCPGNGAAQSELGPTVSADNPLQQIHRQPDLGIPSVEISFSQGTLDCDSWQLKLTRAVCFQNTNNPYPSVTQSSHTIINSETVTSDACALCGFWKPTSPGTLKIMNYADSFSGQRCQDCGHFLHTSSSHILPNLSAWAKWIVTGTMDVLKGICQGMTREQSRCQLHNATEGGDFVSLKRVRSKEATFVCSEHTIRKIFLCTHVYVGTCT